MKERFAKHLLVAIPILALLVLCFCVSGEELEVGSGKTYSTIQDAIDAASENDTINVYSSGSPYNENLIITKSITLNGADGKSSTIINGDDQYKITITIDAVNVQISGFTIKNELGTNNPINKGCIKINYGDGCVINDNIIKNGYDGIDLVFSSGVLIYDNTIEDTFGQDHNIGNGIYLLSSSNNQIYNNIIRNHNNRGLYLTSSSNNNIYGNTISGNFDNGIYFQDSSNNNIVYDNEFLDNKNGHAEEYSSSNTWYYNSQGNYWDDYNGEDKAPQDGRGDTPYDIPGGSNQDLYPLGNFIEEGQSPVANIVSISPNPAEVDEIIYFVGGYDDDGTIASWYWEFGDGSTSTERYPTHQYASSGTYSIKLRVQDNYELWSDYDQQTLIIQSTENNPPSVTTMSILPTQATFGDTVYFSGEGSDSDSGDSIAGYEWSSNLDGVLYTGNSFTKDDLSVGTHTISFKVKDTKDSWSSSTTKTITINPDLNNDNNDPIPDVGGPYEGASNSSITFDGSDSYDSDDGDSITRYYWDFGDGDSEEGAKVSHTYSQSGTYTVELTVTDDNGAQSKDTTLVTITEESGGPNGGSNGDQGEEKEKLVLPGLEIAIAVIIVIIILSFIMYIKR